MGGHSESLNIEFENDFDLSDIRMLLHQQDGIITTENKEDMM